MYKLFMALRYLRAHRIIYFSIAGVAMGIAVMIIVLSVMGGFSATMKERIRGVQSDIVVRVINPKSVFYTPDQTAAELRKVPFVTGCSPRLEYLVWMQSRTFVRRQRDAMQFPDFLLVGIDPEQEKGTGRLPEYFAAGEPGRLAPEAFATEGNLPILVAGSEVNQGFSENVQLQTARQADFPMYLTKEFRVRGSFKSGMAEYDSKLLFGDIGEVRKFLRWSDEPYCNVFAIGVQDYTRNGAAVVKGILDALHGLKACDNPATHEDGRCGMYVIRTWEEERSTLLAAVEVEKGIQFIIIFCIVIVAGFNIIAIYTLMVRSKTRDVGILKSLGGTPGGITSVFLLSGAACGLVGSVIGIGMGLLISLNLNGIVDFVRISSRELNRLALFPAPGAGGALRDSSPLVWPAVLYAGAMAALIVSWVRLYRRHEWTAWITAAVTGVLFAAAAWTMYTWVPGYKPRHEYDWAIEGSVRFWIVAITGALPLLWCLVRRLTARVYDIGVGHALRMLATVIYSALLVGALGSFAVALALGLTQPGRRFEGYDLFPRTIYYFDRLPVVINPVSIGVVVVATLFVSVVFSIYPAIRAARTDPIEAIRDE